MGDQNDQQETGEEAQGNGENVEGQKEEQLEEEIRVEDVEVSRSEIVFGNSTPLFPGAIEEIDFSVSFNQREDSK